MHLFNLERGKGGGGGHLPRGTITSKELPFIILCVEGYENQKGLSGEEVTDLFNENSVFQYIKDFYGALHVMGTK